MDKYAEEQYNIDNINEFNINEDEITYNLKYVSARKRCKKTNYPIGSDIQESQIH